MTEEDEDGTLRASAEKLPLHQQNIEMDQIINAAKEQVGTVQLQYLPNDSEFQLNEEQQKHVDELSNPDCRGIHVLSGVPGSGKNTLHQAYSTTASKARQSSPNERHYRSSSQPALPNCQYSPFQLCNWIQRSIYEPPL